MTDRNEPAPNGTPDLPDWRVFEMKIVVPESLDWRRLGIMAGDDV